MPNETWTVQIDRDRLFPRGIPPNEIEGIVDDIIRQVSHRFGLMLAGMTIIARYDIWNVECLTDDERDFLVGLGGKVLDPA